MSIEVTSLPMMKVISGKIKDGKIISGSKIPNFKDGAEVKIFIFPKQKNTAKFFGKGKGIFGDGLKYQKQLRKEWK